MSGILKIEGTKEHYKSLITKYCGEWMLNSYKKKGDIISKRTDDLEESIFSFTKDAGLERWIEYDTEIGKYFPTAENELHKFVDLYSLRQKTL